LKIFAFEYICFVLKGLVDEEEFVVYRVLKALACFVRLALLKRKTIYEFLRQVASLVCHPVGLLISCFFLSIDHLLLESLASIKRY
jgi:hypothetical protein